MRKIFIVKRGLIFFKTLNSARSSAQWDLSPASKGDQLFLEADKLGPREYECF